MYHTLHCFEETKLVQKPRFRDHALPFNDLNYSRKNSVDRYRLFDQHWAPFCRHSDDLVGRIEFEIGLKK